jgi:hypothetical protein
LKEKAVYGFKTDFKTSNNCSGSGNGGGNSNSVSDSTEVTSGNESAITTTAEQQFNIFPAIFSRQLNFHHHHHHHQPGHTNSSKLMDELRPNLGLLGLVEEHHHLSHHHHLHHEKRIAKTENPDFSALYALPGSNLDQQHSSPVRNLSDHSGKSFKLTATILKQHKVN